MPVTVTTGTTVTWQVALNLSFDVLTVIVALPVFTAVTTPFVLTVAAAVFEELHVTVWLAAPAGRKVTVRASVCEGFIDKVAWLICNEVAGTGTTVTLQLALNVPFDVLTVMVVVPVAAAVITPLALTVAAAVFEEIHTTSLGAGVCRQESHRECVLLPGVHC